METKIHHPLLKTYSYQVPTRIVFGLGSFERLKDELKRFEFKRALLITGKTVCKTDACAWVREVLSSIGGLAEFNEVPPEPDAPVLAVLTKIVRRNPPDLIVGLGGGSSLDMAKMASLLTVNEKDPIAYFKGEPVAKKGPPIVTVPTIAGTGSEVTPISVVVDRGLKLALHNHHLYPALTVIDPALSVTASPQATASAGIDALCHAVESIMSVDSNPITASLAFEATSLVDDYLERAYCNGEDVEARNGLALASAMAGMAFANTGLSLAHGIAYTYATRCKLPHGASVGVAEPYVIEFNSPSIPDKAEVIAAGLGLDTQGLSTSGVGYAIALRMIDIMETVGLPLSLEDLGLEESDLEPMVGSLLKNYLRFIVKNPRKPSREELLKLYRTMLEGY
ncbi:MAG: iron-containing alcohol dehydrogenase [Candidatus Verstraetearchaeota archaeon]|nr:iron-containing alcohol dehydrogenase [Candidatus Verstraetearchaeota archaeon]